MRTFIALCALWTFVLVAGFVIINLTADAVAAVRRRWKTWLQARELIGDSE